MEYYVIVVSIYLSNTCTTPARVQVKVNITDRVLVLALTSVYSTYNRAVGIYFRECNIPPSPSSACLLSLSHNYSSIFFPVIRPTASPADVSPSIGI